MIERFRDLEEGAAHLHVRALQHRGRVNFHQNKRSSVVLFKRGGGVEVPNRPPAKKRPVADQPLQFEMGPLVFVFTFVHRKMGRQGRRGEIAFIEKSQSTHHHSVYVS